MTKHTIKMQDWLHDEPRTIVWNEETGEVSGDHVVLQNIRNMLAFAERTGGFRNSFGAWHLSDPRHDPACFVVVLIEALGRDFDHAALPEPLRSVDPGGLFERAVLPPGTVA